MQYLTIEEAAKYFGISKEAIHNRIRRGTLKFKLQNGVKLVEINPSSIKTKPKNSSTNYEKKYYDFLEEQNQELLKKIQKLEDETKSLREQKEMMLIREREKIEQIYKEKDEQLKNILNAISSKFLLEAKPLEEDISQDLVDVEIQEVSYEQEDNLISLKKYLKRLKLNEKKVKKVKKKIEKIAKKDDRFTIKDKKIYLYKDKNYDDII
jgi:excisionase family DNA binding protein